MVRKPLLIEPLKFRPLLQAKIWGGDGLFRLLGKGDASNTRLGESWELSDYAGCETTVSGGMFDGENFHNLYQRHRIDILGSQASGAGDRFPLLYKFIYADQNLSVQVHPGKNSPLGDAKTECWYIVDAPPGAELILGLQPGDDRAAILETLKGKDCGSLLRKVPVKPGDLVFIPAGTVHAITPGILIYEVQQNSDTTFRLYDWDRLDDEGRPRQLHVKEAAQILDFTSHDRHKIEPLSVMAKSHREDYLVACPYFALVKYRDCKGPVHLPERERFTVLTCVKGCFSLFSHAAPTMEIELGQTVLLPASCGKVVLQDRCEGNSEIIASFVPDLQRDIIDPLLSAKHTQDAIGRLGGYYGIDLEGAP